MTTSDTPSVWAVYTRLSVLPDADAAFHTALADLYTVQQTVPSFLRGEVARLGDHAYMAVSYWSAPDGYDIFHELPARLERIGTLLATLDPAEPPDHYRGQILNQIGEARDRKPLKGVE